MEKRLSIFNKKIDILQYSLTFLFWEFPSNNFHYQ